MGPPQDEGAAGHRHHNELTDRDVADGAKHQVSVGRLERDEHNQHEQHDGEEGVCCARPPSERAPQRLLSAIQRGLRVGSRAVHHRSMMTHPVSDGRFE